MPILIRLILSLLGGVGASAGAKALVGKFAPKVASPLAKKALGFLPGAASLGGFIGGDIAGQALTGSDEGQLLDPNPTLGGLLSQQQQPNFDETQIRDALSLIGVEDPETFLSLLSSGGQAGGFV